MYGRCQTGQEVVVRRNAADEMIASVEEWIRILKPIRIVVVAVIPVVLTRVRAVIGRATHVIKVGRLERSHVNLPPKPDELLGDALSVANPRPVLPGVPNILKARVRAEFAVHFYRRIQCTVCLVERIVRDVSQRLIRTEGNACVHAIRAAADSNRI